MLLTVYIDIFPDAFDNIANLYYNEGHYSLFLKKKKIINFITKTDLYDFIFK